MANKMESIFRYLRISCLVLGAILFAAGWTSENFDFLAISLFAFWLHNVFYCFGKPNDCFLLLLLHMTIFTFLISRPFIGTLRGIEWWNNDGQQPQNVKFVIFVIALSLFMLYFGAELVKKILVSKQGSKGDSEKMTCFANKKWVQILQAVSFVIFIITMLFFLTQEVEKLIYMRGKIYVIYYTGFHSKLPGIIYFLASFMKYSLCLFLATMPSKKKAFFPLLLFGISAIPSLLVGIRNPIMLNALFILMYYLIRDILGDKKKWLGRVEKVLIIVGTPVMLVFMNLYAYIRSENAIKIQNPFTMIVNFFYSQGVTFDVLTKGYGYRLNLPTREFRNYTFGGIIDYIHYGTIGQKIFGTLPLPSGNNWSNGRMSNNLSHNLSYVMNEDAYLNGNGWGSSYLLENFVDFGYIGVAVFSLLLGIVLILILKKIGKSVLLDTIFLISLTSIFFIPRAEATGWLTFIVTAQFWVCIGGCYLAAYIFMKCNWLYRILQKIKLCPKVEEE